MGDSLCSNGREVTMKDPYTHYDPQKLYVERAIPGKGADLEAFYSNLNVTCDCKDNCKPDTCKCINLLGISYNDGVLIDHKFSNNSSVLECSPFCSCPSNCNNTVIQMGPNPFLKIKMTERKGLGVFTTDTIEKGTFICEYTGELIGKQEAIKRLNKKNYMKNNYIMVLREHSANRIIETFIDATLIGNIGRYINHSCNPNCIIVAVRTGSEVPRPCIFSSRRIEKGEEVAYMYGNTGHKRSRKWCYCGDVNCTRFLPRDDFQKAEKSQVVENNSNGKSIGTKTETVTDS